MAGRRRKPVQYSCQEEAEFRRILDAIPPPPPPDGGWGWLVVLGAFLINVIVDGVCLSFGVLMPQLLHFTGQRWLASLIGSLLLGFCFLSGPLTSALANRYGCRRIAVAGSIIAAISFIGANVAPTPFTMAITYGGLAGVGYGMMYLPSILCIGLYFERRRALATAAAVCGSGFGTLVLAPLAAWLLEEYDWRGALVLVSGLALNGVVAGSLFRPLDDDLRRRRKVILRKMEVDKRMGPRTCLIMQRLIDEKRRQRTLSTGSLNGVVITRDNQLLRGEELAAAMAAAQQQQLQQQQLRRRTTSASLLDRLLRGSLGRGSTSSSASGRGSPAAATTPLSTHRVLPATAQQQPPHSLRQVRSVGSQMYEQHLVSSGGASSGAAGAMPAARESFRSLLANRLLPRNASTRSFTSGMRQQQLQLLPLTSSQEPQQQALAPADGGVVNPATSISDGDSLCPTPDVTIAIEDDGCDSSSEEPVAAAADQQPSSQQATEASWSPATASPAALPDDPTESAATHRFMYQLKKMLQQQDAPMYRQDIYFSGSVVNLPQYQAAASLDSYLKSITIVHSETAARTRIPVYAAAAEVAEVEEAIRAAAVAAGEPTGTSGIWRYLTCVPDTVKDTISTTLDLRTLKSPTFLLFSISTILTMLGFFAPFAFLLEASLDAGVDESLAPYLVSLLGVSITVGRIAAGSLANYAWIDCLIVNEVALVLAGGMTLLVPVCATFLTLSLYAIVYGLCIAVFVSLRSIIVVELMGLEKLTSAFGQLILFQGCAVIVGTPAAGYLRDFTGDYTLTFYVAGALIALSGILCLPLRRVAEWERGSRSGDSQERLRMESVSASGIEAQLDGAGREQSERVEPEALS